MRLALAFCFGGALGAQGVNGKWVADATPVDASRTGFATDTVLPEFGALAAPERVDPILTSLELTVASGVTGTYSDAQGITCAVNGTFNPVTGAVAIAGTCGDWDVSATLTFAGGALAGTLTVARDSGGASSENRTWSATRGAAVALSGTHYYVDSRAGSALNDGISAAAPLDSTSTIALAEDDTLWLARGTRLREMVYSEEDGVSCRAYGVGPRPILEGSVLAGTWSKTATYTNVWELSYTPAFDYVGGGATWIPLLNGVAMKRIGRTTSALATDLTALDADPGACVVPQSDLSGTYTIHIYAASDPNASGDVYELPALQGCLWFQGGTSTTMASIHGRACAGDNGPIRSGTQDSLIYDCIAEWGPLHDIYYTANSEVKHSVALFAPAVWRSGIPYGGVDVVGYVVDGESTAEATLSDCAVIQFPRTDLEGINIGCYAHTAFGVNEPWAHIAYSQMYIAGVSTMIQFGVRASTLLRSDVDRLFGERSNGRALFSISGSVTRSRIYNHVVGYDPVFAAIAPDVAAEELTVDQCLFVASATNLYGTLQLNCPSCSVDRCTFVNDHFPEVVITNVDPGQLISFRHNAVVNGDVRMTNSPSPGIATGGSDYNQAYGTQVWDRNVDLAFQTWPVNWRTQNPDLDQNSVNTQPTWSDATGDRPLCNVKTDGANTGHGTFTRTLTFAAAGYTPAVAGDIGGLVTGGTTGDTGRLESYDNGTREWVVVPLTTGDTFASTEAVTIVEAWSGQGAGTTAGASVLVPGFEFDFETDQPTGYAWANFVDAITP